MRDVVNGMRFPRSSFTRSVALKYLPEKRLKPCFEFSCWKTFISFPPPHCFRIDFQFKGQCPLAHSPETLVRNNLLSRRLSVKERRGVAEELCYSRYQMHHEVRPVLLPIINRGFSDPDALCDLPLEKPQLQPSLLDMVSSGGKNFRDFRGFLAFKDDFEAVPNGNASVIVRELRESESWMHLEAESGSKER